jgi:hypothetical protein
MPFPFSTFEQLVTSMAFRAGLNPFDSSLGPVNLNSEDLAQWAELLSEAANDIWKPDKERPDQAWPYTVLTGTLTITAGVISFDLIGRGDFWRFWTGDPRTSPRGTVAPVESTFDSSGIYPSTSAGTVFTFWRPLRPKFSSTVWVAATTYPDATYVYDPTVRLTGQTQSGGSASIVLMTDTTGVQVGQQVTGPNIQAGTKVTSVTANTNIHISNAATAAASGLALVFGTGECYMSFGAQLGSDILDPTKWIPQRIPDPMAPICVTFAEAYRVRSKGNAPKNYMDQAYLDLKSEIGRSLPEDGPAPPWDFSFATDW